MDELPEKLIIQDFKKKIEYAVGFVFLTCMFVVWWYFVDFFEKTFGVNPFHDKTNKSAQAALMAIWVLCSIGITAIFYVVLIDCFKERNKK